MLFHSSQFILSAASMGDWPKHDELEISFCGRSNVGKSSLLNELLTRKGLAKVSRTPGSTEWINFYQSQLSATAGFLSPKRIFISDLPGFGFAARSQGKKNVWRTLMEAYFTQRKQLKIVCLLCDARRALIDPVEQLAEEKQLFDYFKNLGKTVLLIMTKSDQLPKHQRKIALGNLSSLFLCKAWMCSTQTKEGLPEILDELKRKISIS